MSMTTLSTTFNDSLLHAAARVHVTFNELASVSGSTGAPTAAELPDGDPTAPSGLADAAGQLIGIGKWVGLVLGIGGIIACGMMMAIGRRNNSRMSADGASGLMWVVAGVSVILLSVPIVGAVSGAF